VPGFEGEVLPVGRAFWEVHQTGRTAVELEGTLAGVLVRNVEAEGWYAPYRTLTSDGGILSLEEWFKDSSLEKGVDSMGLYADPVHRLDNLASPFVGDLLLVSDYGEGYYFSAPLKGVHGGLHPDDSGATLVYGWPGVGHAISEKMRIAVFEDIETRCRNEGGRQPSTADLLTGLLAVLE